MNIKYYLAVLLLLVSCSEQKTPSDNNTKTGSSKISSIDPKHIFGHWTGRAPWGEFTKIHFEKKGNISINVDGIKADGTYEVDFSKNPIELDILWKEDGLVQTIIKFQDENNLVIVESIPGQVRPTEFNHMSTTFRRR